MIWNITGLVFLAGSLVSLIAGKGIESKLSIIAAFLAFIIAKMEDFA